MDNIQVNFVLTIPFIKDNIPNERLQVLLAVCFLSYKECMSSHILLAFILVNIVFNHLCIIGRSVWTKVQVEMVSYRKNEFFEWNDKTRLDIPVYEER